MAEYYELSITKCQSAQQQSFNNELVELVRKESNNQGWLYAPCFTDKNLRDRIRCYYKTHIQNAKKRLRTMVKNPTKRANARHLCAHLDMIEKNVEKNAQTPCIDPETSAVITHQDWGQGYAGEVKDAAENIVSASDRAASFEARVAASVAVATKTLYDGVTSKTAKNGMAPSDIAPRPDDHPVLSSEMLTVPSETPAPSVKATNGGDPIAAEAVAMAEAAIAEKGTESGSPHSSGATTETAKVVTPSDAALPDVETPLPATSVREEPATPEVKSGAPFASPESTTSEVLFV